MYKKYGMRQKRSDFFSGSGSWVGARWWSITLQCEDKAIGPGSVGNWVLLKDFDPGKDIQNAPYKPNSDGGLWHSTRKKNYENPGGSEYVLTEEHLREKLEKNEKENQRQMQKLHQQKVGRYPHLRDGGRDWGKEHRMSLVNRNRDFQF